MTVSVSVMYANTEGSTFDYDYFMSKHMKIVEEHWGAQIESSTAIRGLSGGPKTPPGFHLVVTMYFKDQDAMKAALANSKEVMADVPNYTNVRPAMLIGEVLG